MLCPFKATEPWWLADPGRCPGLTCFGPFGAGETVSRAFPGPKSVTSKLARRVSLAGLLGRPIKERLWKTKSSSVIVRSRLIIFSLAALLPHGASAETWDPEAADYACRRGLVHQPGQQQSLRGIRAAGTQGFRAARPVAGRDVREHLASADRSVEPDVNCRSLLGWARPTRFSEQRFDAWVDVICAPWLIGNSLRIAGYLLVRARSGTG